MPLPRSRSTPKSWPARRGRPVVGVRFPEELEPRFRVELHRARSRRSRITGLAAVLIYAAFAITDRFLLPDAYLQAWAIRFFLVIPLIIFCTFGIDRVRDVTVREVLLAAMVVVTALSTVWISELGHSEHALRYHSGISLVVLFGNTMLGLRFREAAAVSAVIALAYAAVLLQAEGVPAEPRISNWVFFLAFVMISLIANFRMEQDRRRAYLGRLREQERNGELSEAVSVLGRLSTEDALTGVANRREFDRRLALEWGRARRDAQPLTLLLADVDYFKNYNDCYGHPAGDECLRQIGLVLCAVPQRSSDLVARLGGEEFAVLLPATGMNDAEKMAEKMRTAILELNLPHVGSTAAPVVSASFGIATMLPTQQAQAADLLVHADSALYNAKKRGRNRVAIHTL